MTRNVTATVYLELDLDVTVEMERDDDGLPGPSVTGNGLTGPRGGLRVTDAYLNMTDEALLACVKRAIGKQINFIDEDEVRECEYAR